MIKRFFSIAFIFLMGIGLCGCKDTTPRIFLSTQPITKETFIPMEEFKKNDTINFVLISPKGFKSDTVRMQLIKKAFVSPIYGDTLEQGRDFNVEHTHYLTGAFTVYSAGRYELRFYDSDGTRKKTLFQAKTYTPRPNPLAYVQFGVYD